MMLFRILIAIGFMAAGCLAAGESVCEPEATACYNFEEENRIRSTANSAAKCCKKCQNDARCHAYSYRPTGNHCYLAINSDPMAEITLTGCVSGKVKRGCSQKAFAPKGIPNGKVEYRPQDGSAAFSPGTATITCNEEYFRTGPATYTCSGEGIWNAPFQTTCSRATDPVCEVEKSENNCYKFLTNDFDRKETNSPELCCKICSDDASCYAYTYESDGDHCYLLTAGVKMEKIKKSGCVSGKMKRGCSQSHIAPKGIPNGKITFVPEDASLLFSPGKATVKCQDDYTLIGYEKYICSLDEGWDHVFDSRCIANVYGTCDFRELIPPNFPISKTQRRYQKYLTDDTVPHWWIIVKVNCNYNVATEFYRTIGPTEYRCNNVSEWEPIFSTRCITYCVSESLTDTTAENREIAFELPGEMETAEGTAKVTCSADTILVGPAEYNCSTESGWNAEFKSFCIQDQGKCPKNVMTSKSIENGGIKFLTDYQDEEFVYVPGTATVTCDPGFNVDGKTEYQCQNGEWENDFNSECKIEPSAKCEIDNSTKNCYEIENSTVRHAKTAEACCRRCAEDPACVAYSFRSTDEICYLAGFRSMILTVALENCVSGVMRRGCSGKSFAPIGIPNGKIEYQFDNATEEYSEGTATITCNPKYTLVGHSTYSCTQYALWDKPFRSFCKKDYILCEPTTLVPANFLNGKLKYGFYSDSRIPTQREIVINQRIVEVACNGDSHLVGPAKYKCLKYAKWDKEFTSRCVKYCTTDATNYTLGNDAVKNGKMKYQLQSSEEDEEETIQSTLNITCDAGYSIVGPERYQCTENNFWNDKLDTYCVKKDGHCTKASLISYELDNGKIEYVIDEGSKVYPPGYAKVTCNNGFIHEGPEKYHCQNDFQWDQKFRTNCAQKHSFCENEDTTSTCFEFTAIAEYHDVDPDMCCMRCRQNEDCGLFTFDFRYYTCFIGGVDATYKEWNDFPCISGKVSRVRAKCSKGSIPSKEIANGFIEIAIDLHQEIQGNATVWCKDGFVLNGKSKYSCKHATGWDMEHIPECHKLSTAPRRCIPEPVQGDCYSFPSFAVLHATSSEICCHFCKEDLRCKTYSHRYELELCFLGEYFNEVHRFTTDDCVSGRVDEVTDDDRFCMKETFNKNEFPTDNMKIEFTGTGVREGNNPAVTGYLKGTAKVTCEEGYTIDGPSEYSCDSVWTKNLYSKCVRIACQREYLTLNKPANGDIEYTTCSDGGAKAEVSCNEGYTLLGQSSYKCTPSTPWKPTYTSRCKKDDEVAAMSKDTGTLSCVRLSDGAIWDAELCGKPVQVEGAASRVRLCKKEDFALLNFGEFRLKNSSAYEHLKAVCKEECEGSVPMIRTENADRLAIRLHAEKKWAPGRLMVMEQRKLSPFVRKISLRRPILVHPLLKIATTMDSKFDYNTIFRRLKPEKKDEEHLRCFIRTNFDNEFFQD